jgi:UDP-N-acetylmuramyl pentapeptide phosphotransferase/UDP-N-acetylglucosamine-1-phosphate transferase
MDIPDIFFIGFWTIVAFALAKNMIPVLLLIAKRKHLFDDGDEDHRKLHDGLVPTLGGVAIFTAFIISYSASSFADNIDGYGYFVSAACILFAACLKDDFIVISPVKKLVAQIAATALIVFGCGMQFTNLGGVFGIYAISPWIGIPLTFFTVIVVINAFNLIDGIDGLGGALGIFVIGFLGTFSSDYSGCINCCTFI